MRLGIDIGGTFTDFILTDEAGESQYVWKSLTTPRNPVEGVVNGLQECLDFHGLEAGEVDLAIHATTLITNAIIERQGARTGLITTSGFADLLEIRREVRYDLYDLKMRLPEPLVPASRRLEVSERVDTDGQCVQELDEHGVLEAARQLVDDGVEAVAICFLHSYRNPAHERRAVELVKQVHPEVAVSSSAGVAPEIREYERFSTTAANAYVQPLAGRYLSAFKSQLSAMNVTAPLFIMLSNGGFSEIGEAAEHPVRSVESGPAAGALIAGHIARSVGYEQVLAFDMGGTTAKLCVVDDGDPILTHNLEVARVHRFKRGSGLPLLIPSVELIEIGAGGGSVARVDELNLLSVGPRSAGADPGPACYGHGGTEPTVTDADLVLGYLNPDYFLGGRMRLDPAAARKAIATTLSDQLGLDPEQAALGIHDLVNENMATAASVYIAELGRDPRDFTIVATGGAGPVHAAGVARRLGSKRVLIPPTAGVASSAGLLVAPPRIDLAVSHPIRLDHLSEAEVNDVMQGLETEARRRLAGTLGPGTALEIEHSVDMRYVNQGHEVNVSAPPGPVDHQIPRQLEDRFEETYRRLFGRSIPGVPVECITWRVSARAESSDLRLRSPDVGSGGDGQQSRSVRFDADGPRIDTPVFQRASCVPDEWRAGPAIIEEAESTTVVPPGDRWRVDHDGNVLIEIGAGRPL